MNTNTRPNGTGGSANPFWDYSLALYGAEGVAPPPARHGICACA